MKEFPLISIVIITYNNESVSIGGAESIRRALDSLIHQSWPNIEIIIQDDCSDDNTLNILREYNLKYTNVKLYKNIKNLGVIENFTSILQRVNGEYFLWACVDDYYHQDYIKNCMKRLIDSPEKIACQSYIQMNKLDQTTIFKYHREINIPNISEENKVINKILLPRNNSYSGKNFPLNPFIHAVQRTVFARYIYEYPFLLYFEEVIPLLFIWMGGICCVENILFENCAKKVFSEKYSNSSFVKKKKNYLFVAYCMVKVLFVFISLKFRKIIKVKWIYIITTWYRLIPYYCRYFFNDSWYKIKISMFEIINKCCPKLILFYRKIKKLIYEK